MPNNPVDLQYVQRWLERWARSRGKLLFLTSVLYNWEIDAAIRDFQRNVMGESVPSGIIMPRDKTAIKLQSNPIAQSPMGSLSRLSLSGNGRPPVGPLPLASIPGTPLRLPARTGFAPLSEADWNSAAETIGCETLMLKALGNVEGRGTGFDHYNRPTILFEPTHFARLAAPSIRHIEGLYPDLTHLHPKPHPYGPDSLQWKHFEQAYLLSPRAALKAVSWGHFQQLGEFFTDPGYASVEHLVNDICISEQMQLDILLKRVTNTNMQGAMIAKDWTAIAEKYNGALQQGYDIQLKAAYEKLKKNGNGV
ncbi:N-acetylmuramidase domain-containing protein [Granulicella mallensis]|uniref:N-acetylmuramidase domain-containing protein n=1 Tax=Granulicella mallensis TaxID=940614 RepID=A0A7W8ED70_9BACT|nr:N-acetylmuramidase domain-containing protein [Granulicella mallensis]MBB5066410.1 hypothetical protein [Granulicella mallensis]